MNVIQLSAQERAKSLAQVGRDLKLSPTFGSPSELQSTLVLLARHVDDLRLRVGLLEIEQRRRWWHPCRDAYRRWRLRS